MLVGFLVVAVLFFASLCTAGWYAVKIVIVAFSAAGSLYCGEHDRCDCVQEEIAVLRNASLAQCAWVQATLLREKAAEALAASGLSQWLKLCENCEWLPDIWSLLALACSLFIVRWHRNGRKRKDGARVARPQSPRCVTTPCKHPGAAGGDRVCSGISQGTERKQRTFSTPFPSTSDVTAKPTPHCVPYGFCRPAALSTAASKPLPTTAALPPRRTGGARRVSGGSSHSWPPSKRRSGPEPRPVPWGQPHLAPASKWVFGELLQECRHGASVTFDVVLKEIALQGIVANLHNTTVGLSRLRTAYCVWGKYPELLTSACRSYRERKGSGYVTDDDHDLCLPYVVLHMTFAGWPLSNVTLESPLQLWSLVQQVALTLAVAEEVLEFEHRALSEDHVLVKKAHHDVLTFRLNGRMLHVNTFGVHAFLVDFCAARLRPLGGLTRRLVKRFESRFAAAVDEAEQEAWCDMCFWLDEMPYCASATELALQMAM
ncbi:hypothetical protein HPB49_022069 [Dermacentor silvarum]|uniref:Uncharacterized protein n=1 Tax=Dermacentor silvarum TaxID=543639 RepID=A0ACB8D0F4_DERSI|nr:hypothetical protein HPB49_022069 [Dermacentor silvarum]